MTTKTKTPREPRGPTISYMRRLKRIWHTTQGLFAYALEPLLDVWDEGLDERLDIKDPEGPPLPAYATPQQATRDYRPLAPRPRLPRIWNLSDAELERLWPSLRPVDVRDFAPWATTRSEVRRLMGQGPLAQMSEVEAFVRAAVETSRAAQPAGAPRPSQVREQTRPPGAFRLRPRYYAPVVLGANGLPLPTPPTTWRVTPQAITRTWEWLELATGELLRPENIADEVGLAGRSEDFFSRREMQRVLSIDVRKVPGTQMLIDQWRDLNVGLIETGLTAEGATPKLRPGLLPDVSKVVEAAHAEGIRVEVLAHDLQERFGVSDSRAELIARDQTLKLNGQLARHRQLGVGVEEYIWSTSDDRRVRPSHQELDGTTQNWNAPPSVGHPGTDFQCRCVAIPIIPE